MSFSLSLKNRDIEIKGDTLHIVHGLGKLEQDLSIWLRERYGTDRFNPHYGSTLDGFIGGVVDELSTYEVITEVERVLKNYQALQLRRVRDDPQSLSQSEILRYIGDIRATVHYDRVIVTAQVGTYTGTRTISIQTDLV